MCAPTEEELSTALLTAEGMETLENDGGGNAATAIDTRKTHRASKAVSYDLYAHV